MAWVIDIVSSSRLYLVEWQRRRHRLCRRCLWMRRLRLVLRCFALFRGVSSLCAVAHPRTT